MPTLVRYFTPVEDQPPPPPPDSTGVEMFADRQYLTEHAAALRQQAAGLRQQSLNYTSNAKAGLRAQADALDAQATAEEALVLRVE
jgi:hypothetical protein